MKRKKGIIPHLSHTAYVIPNLGLFIILCRIFSRFPGKADKKTSAYITAEESKRADQLPNIFILSSSKLEVKEDLRKMNKIYFIYKINLCILYNIPSCKEGSLVVKYSQKG